MASASINEVNLMGNLGDAPEVRYLPDGTPTARFSLATTDVWKDRDTGERKERTEWHRVIFFGSLASIVAEHLIKGSHVYISGSLRTRKWQDRDNIDRYTTEIRATTLKMLGKKPDGAVPSAPAANQPPPPSSIPPDFNDDIPF